MANLLLLSILVATVAMPSLAAREPDARRGLARLLVRMFTFVVVYWLIVLFVTPRP